MTQISSITVLPTGTNEATVSFDNGYQMLVRIIDEFEGATTILTPSNKLVRINADKSCKILAEGVSIR